MSPDWSGILVILIVGSVAIGLVFYLIREVILWYFRVNEIAFLDLEPIRHHDKYAGRRIKRGMFRSATGRLINADLNGAYNIIRKVAPSAFANGVEDVAVHPVALAIN